MKIFRITIKHNSIDSSKDTLAKYVLAESPVKAIALLKKFSIEESLPFKPKEQRYEDYVAEAEKTIEGAITLVEVVYSDVIIEK